MLTELAVSGLGVIDELTLLLGPGMTAVTGETGAGKTLVVTAIDLLVGGRADSSMVAAGRSEAVVEGRFVQGDEEIVLRRVVPAEGRTRAYIDGRLATVHELAEVGARIVDLHGQHAHQSLLRTAAQRQALDQFAGVDLGPLRAVREQLARVQEHLGALGGDERARVREIDLLRYQVDELGRIAPELGEDERLEAEEAVLADASSHREAAATAAELLAGEGDAPAVDGLLGAARAALEGRTPFAALEARIRSATAEIDDIAHELTHLSDTITDDPERLTTVRDRLTALHELRRKYGSTLDDVLTYRDETVQRLADLEGYAERAAALEAETSVLASEITTLESVVGHQRRLAAPDLSDAATAHLSDLALPQGVLEVVVGSADPGDDVEFLFTANDGTPLRPLRKVASGGELARIMLALRLVLTAGPETLVFDEVDAGIGGSAALAVGRSLAALGTGHQVLVVTHLPQVAAYADAQAAVVKEAAGGHTATSVRVLDRDERIIELSRMLSGSPDSDKARGHARELIATAAAERAR